MTPTHLEIEKGLLSGVAQWPDAVIPQVMLNGGRDLFSVEQNRIIFDCIHGMWGEGQQFDMIICSNSLDKKDLLKGIGGAAYLAQFWFTCATPEIGSYYLEILLDEYGRRKLLKACADSSNLAAQPSEELSEIVANHQHQLSDIAVIVTGKEKTWAELVEERWLALKGDIADEAIIQTGIGFLDEYSKMYRGSMPLIGGQRKSGKTTLALSILLNIAKQRVPSAYVTLEESVDDTVDKLLSAIARIPLTGRREHETEFEKAAMTLSTLPITVVDNLRRLSQISAWCQDAAKRNGLGFIVVDYAQIIIPDTAHKDANRQEKVAEISRELRNTAAICKIPMLLLSQLNAEQETRESRALEQDCSAMWRIDTIEDEPNLRKLLIPFQRHGPSGKGTKVAFLGDICRVENLAHEP